MFRQSPTILVFGTEIGPERGEETGPRSDRVSVENIKANLKTVMESVNDLVHATPEGLRDLHVSHVDVGVAISPDGSVGLVGTGGSSSADATLKVRLQFRKPYRGGF